MKKKSLSLIKIFLIAYFAITLVLPLVFMVKTACTTNFLSVLSSEQFLKGSKNSILLALCATIISVALALALAFALERSNIKHKNLIVTLLTLPMLIPSISHGMGLIILLGKNGFFTNLFHLDYSVYGFSGVLIGSVLYSFPPAFLMMIDVLRYQDCSSYSAADILGVPKFNQFIKITVPYLKKPLLNIIFATFTLVITDYGVPLIVGGSFTTLPVVMFQEVIGRLNFNVGTVIGITLLIPAVIAFFVDMFTKGNSEHSFVSAKKILSRSKLRDGLSYALCALVCTIVILPIASFAVLSVVKKYPIDMSLTFNNILGAFNMGAGKFVLNSFLIAIATSFIGTFISFITAYITARVHDKSSKLIHLFSITSLAVPGLVLGLTYVLTFKTSFIYGTLIILIMVNITHFFSTPYLMAYNSFGKVNKNLEAVGSTLGINKFYLLKDVLAPQMFGTILQMISYLFVNCMMTISAVSFLYTTKTMPLSIMITQFEAQMMIEYSAFVSLLILAINLLVKLVLGHIQKDKNL